MCAGLDAFTEFLFRVRATNAAGAGRWSEWARIATAPAPPSQPLRIAAAGGSSAEPRQTVLHEDVCMIGWCLTKSRCDYKGDACLQGFIEYNAVGCTVGCTDAMLSVCV